MPRLRRLGAASLLLLGGFLLVGFALSGRPTPPPAALRPAPASGAFTVGGRPITVYALPTGTVTIKGSHHTGVLPEQIGYFARFAWILADRGFAAPMPILTYAIAHPDGVVVVDAGATPGWNDDATWAPDPVSARLVRSFIVLDVQPAEALPARLDAAGLAVDQVVAVALTHQHADHTAAVPAFPGADIWTTRAEDNAAQEIGALPWRWRSDATRVRFVDAEGTASASGLGVAVPLVADGSIEAIHTPGHTPGSLTVRLRTDQGELLFTGDTSFTAAGMDPTAPTAGIHTDLAAVRALQTRIQAYVTANPGTRIFPAHDWEAGTRLSGG